MNKQERADLVSVYLETADDMPRLWNLYHLYFNDCLDSADYCLSMHRPAEAAEYIERAKRYLAILKGGRA